MFYRKSILTLVLAVLTFFVVDGAYAAPPIFGSGGMTNPFKSIITNQDLVCDFDDPRSTLLITEIESPPSFKMETPPGKVIICWEQTRTIPTTRGPDIEFTLTQIVMSPNDGGDNGLVVRSVPNTGANRTVTWEFIVDNAGGSNTEFLEWRLAPVNQSHPVCAGLPPNTQCANRIGVPASPSVSNFPDRDVTGDNLADFGSAGVVFRYTEAVVNGTRLPQTLLLGPCHSGSFNVNDPIVCAPRVNGQTLATRTEGEIPGALIVNVDIQPNSFNVGSKGTNFIRIFGDATMNPPPVATLVINGTPIAANQFTIDDDGDNNGDGFLDSILKINRPAFGTALGCPSTTTTTFNVVVTGTFTSGTLFRGDKDIVTCF